MKTVQEILQASTDFLKLKNIERPRRLAEEILSHALGLKRIDLYLQWDRPVMEEELVLLRGWVKRLGLGEPLEYITGVVSFYGCSIEVDARVLIPRPETEILVDFIVRCLAENQRPLAVWDLCTGSGCIGIALKKKYPFLHVVSSDISPEALAVARKNGEKNGVEISFLQGDLLTPFAGERADLIVVNPPYISLKAYESLDPSVRDFEPRGALVGGERGVEFYERLAEESPSFLNPGGRLFLEMGFDQGDSLNYIFNSPVWAIKRRVQDWSGKDRFFFLEKESSAQV